MMKISRLEREQLQALRRWRERWIRLGTSCAPPDRPAAEEAMSRLYRLARRKPPRRFLWCDSPLTARLAEWVLRYGQPIRTDEEFEKPGTPLLAASLRASLEELADRPLRTRPLGKPLFTPLWKALRTDPGERLEQHVLGNRIENHGWLVGSEIEDRVWRALLDSPWAQINWPLEFSMQEALGVAVKDITGQAGSWMCARVGGRPRDRLVSPARPFDGFEGQLGSFWVGHYRFLESTGAKYPPRISEILACHERIFASAGLWLPYGNICIASGRPESVRLDDHECFHAEDGPAVRYRDGYALWAIHGVLVEEQVVLRPHDLTLEEINKEENAEIKRIKIERFGWDRYLFESGAKVVDMDFDMDGILRSLMRTDEVTVLVCACTSTGRTYAMEVDPKCATCDDASRYLMADPDMRIVAQS